MSLKYEPASEPLHISVNSLTLQPEALRLRNNPNSFETARPPAKQSEPLRKGPTPETQPEALRRQPDPLRNLEK